MIFSPNQIEELLKTIDYYHVLFVAQNIGTSILSSKDKVLLKSSGIDLDKFKEDKNFISQSYKFGILAQVLGSTDTKKISYNDFKSYIQKGNFISLTKKEKGALVALKTQAYSDIKGLGNRAKKTLEGTHIVHSQTQRLKYENQIQQSATRAIVNREGAVGMVSDLGHATQDWGRDFGKISEYIMHSSYENGRADALEEEHGNDVLVYKDVYDGACKWCIQAYLTAGLGSAPRIFKLSELKVNGTNIGRKQNQWLPVLGPMHPYCRCTVNYAELGEIWSDIQGKFVPAPEKYIRKVERKSKIKVYVGDQKFEV